VVEAPDRDALAAHLEARAIATLVHYPSPVHGHPPYRQLGNGPVPLPVAERLSARILSLPMYPELRDDEVDHVAAALHAFG
jgi:dTDP-4-amino-4,6-dideoxygalactose transaminase